MYVTSTKSRKSNITSISLPPIYFLSATIHGKSLIHGSFLTDYNGEGNGNPLQRSCLESPRDGGALVDCHLWGRTELDTTEATQQQQQHLYRVMLYVFISYLIFQLNITLFGDLAKLLFIIVKYSFSSLHTISLYRNNSYKYIVSYEHLGNLQL